MQTSKFNYFIVFLYMNKVVIFLAIRNKTAIQTACVKCTLTRKSVIYRNSSNYRYMRSLPILDE